MPEIRIDGVSIEAPEGVDLVTCLLRDDVRSRLRRPIAPLCGMGTCFQCLVEIDGQPHRRACMERVRAGMEVRSDA